MYLYVQKYTLYRKFRIVVVAVILYWKKIVIDCNLIHFFTTGKFFDYIYSYIYIYIYIYIVVSYFILEVYSVINCNLNYFLLQANSLIPLL